MQQCAYNPLLMKTIVATPPTIKAFFTEHGQQMHYDKKQTFVRADDPQPWVYFLSQGAVEASYVLDYGESKILGYFTPNTVFSQNRLFYDSDGDLTYTTIEPTEIYRVHRDAFLQQVDIDQQFMKEYLQNTLILRIFTTDMVIYQGEPTAERRAIRWLLLMAKYYGESRGDSVQIQVPLTHETIANFLHVSRESVSKTLRQFIRSEHSAVSRKLITIRDVTALKQLLAK